MKLEDISAVELGRKIGSRELSSREVTEYFVERAVATNPHINAFLSITGDEALQRATTVDEQIASGKRTSPLAGVPIAIKDVLCIKDQLTTCGSRMLENFRPPYTATAVQKLLDAGMVPIGKTNMDEFAMGGSTETGFKGCARNPWDTQRTPGGSSGGAAAVLAAGLAPLSIGTDTGGSVRQPAAFCGVLGLKPTYGRVSRYGLVAFASSLDQVGTLAHHAEDLAASLQIISGHDTQDSTSLNQGVPDYTALLSGASANSLKGLRVGVIREQIDNSALQDSIRKAVAEGQQALQDLGAEIVDVHLPHTKYSVATYYLVAPSEASGNLERYDGVHYGYRASLDGKDEGKNAGNAWPLDAMISRSRSEGFGNEVKRRIMLGTFALSAGYYDAYYKKALQVRRLIAGDYTAAFEKVDVLLGPVTPTPAFKIGEKIDDPVQMYLEDLFTVGANLAGIPGLSVPAGFDAQGLPVAIQLQAPAFEEARLINTAYALQCSGFFTPSTCSNVSGNA